MLLETAILTLNVELVKEEREKEEIVGEMETDKGGGRGKRIKERRGKKRKGKERV